MTDMNAFLEPGMLVEHPAQPEWGVGQVQSNINNKITINFPNTGKVVVDGTEVALRPVFQT